MAVKRSTGVIIILALAIFAPFPCWGNFRLPDQTTDSGSEPRTIAPPPPVEGQGRSSSILSIFGLGGPEDSDPFVAQTTANCVRGDLSECFKTHALDSFDEIFYRQLYPLSDYARIVRLPEEQQRSLLHEPFEYSDQPRQEDSEWDQLVKYGLRRAERFVKSTALEVDLPEEFSEAGRYQARFIGTDIGAELDILEDKHASIIKRKKLKRLIIPLLLVLKIFKLKLLLFLPFILGIAGLKKILGLAAIILPGLFAFLRICRPQGFGSSGGGGGFSDLFGLYKKDSFPEYSPQGVGSATFHHHNQPQQFFNRPDPSFSRPYTDYYSSFNGNKINFGPGELNHPQPYDSHFYGRNAANKDIPAEDSSKSNS